MNVNLRQLARMLDEIVAHTPDYSDPEVVIVVQRAHPAVGSRHMVGVKSVGPGMDWEAGKLILDTTEPVYAGLDQLHAAARCAQSVREAVYVRKIDGTRQRNANCLRLIEKALDTWHK
jgi:hypothetical protein